MRKDMGDRIDFTERLDVTVGMGPVLSDGNF